MKLQYLPLGVLVIECKFLKKKFFMLSKVVSGLLRFILSSSDSIERTEMNKRCVTFRFKNKTSACHLYYNCAK